METNQLLNLAPSQLRRAAELKEEIDQLTREFAELLGGNGPAAPGSKGQAGSVRTIPDNGRGKMSAAGRARIAAAARARWAKVKAQGGTKLSSGGSEVGNGRKGKRTMSAAARKKIGAAAKARWAKIRAAKGQG